MILTRLRINAGSAGTGVMEIPDPLGAGAQATFVTLWSTTGAWPRSNWQARNDHFGRVGIQDQDVEDLLSSEDVVFDQLLARVQNRLRQGDRRVADHLRQEVTSIGGGSEPSAEKLWRACTALEVFAAGRSPLFRDEARELVEYGVRSRFPDLQFAAIAAASELPWADQVYLRTLIGYVAQHAASDEVRQAARAFLRF